MACKYGPLKNPSGRRRCKKAPRRSGVGAKKRACKWGARRKGKCPSKPTSRAAQEKYMWTMAPAMAGYRRRRRRRR